MLGPRDGYLTWDELWMAKALLTAMRSKDPNTQVGAEIVDKDNIPIGSGFNGFPRGILNDALPWNRDGEPLYTKYMYMCHAEANAIDNTGCNRERLSKSKIYSTLFPCNECAKRIIQNGIKEVIYLSDKYHDKDEFIAARKMFELTNTNVRQLIIDKEIKIRLKNDL